MSDLFKIKRKFKKMAGTVIPNDPKSWPTEIVKNIAENHPYIDTSTLKLDFVDVDPETKGASGKIIVGEKLAVPFSIRKNDENRKLELDPIDIVYDGNQFKALNESSYADGLQGEAMGRVQNQDERVPSKNQYIGHLTGDVTPLEWSSQPAGGARMVTAGIGILSSMVKNQNDLARLRQMIQSYHGINSALESLGLKKDLVNLGSDMREGNPSNAKMVHVMRNLTGFSIAFNDGDMKQVKPSDLKVFLGDDYYPVMRQVAARGWAVLKDFPDVKSADMDELSVTSGPIDIGGPHLVDTASGRLLGMVASEKLHFDGSVSSEQSFLGKGGEFSSGKEKMMGYRMPDDDCTCAISAGVIAPGVSGVFFDTAFGSARCSPVFKISQVVSMPDMPDVIIATDDNGKKIGLMPSEGVVRFGKINNPPSFMPQDSSYYVPGHMEFFPIRQKIKARDRGAETRVIQKVSLRKNAGAYYLNGFLSDGKQVSANNMSRERAITKLAWLGVDEKTLESVAEMKAGEEKSFRGLRAPDLAPKMEKKASINLTKDDLRTLKMLKIAADEIATAVNESPTAQQDPQVLDAALSLQFVNTENLEEVIDSAPHFEEVEDKLSRMLLAARHGEASIDEKGVSRALQGMGSAIQSIKTLTMALKQRGDVPNREA